MFAQLELGVELRGELAQDCAESSVLHEVILPVQEAHRDWCVLIGRTERAFEGAELNTSCAELSRISEERCITDRLKKCTIAHIHAALEGRCELGGDGHSQVGGIDLLYHSTPSRGVFP